MMQGDCNIIESKRPMETVPVFLILADISGYTRFLRKHGKDIAHAEQAVGELLESVINASSAPLILHELSGDAVSFYALAGPEENIAEEILRQARSFFDAFQRTMKEIRSCPTFIACRACQRAGDLKLKIILHAGEVVITEVGGFRKIAGPNMILAHRLLKNSIEEDEYLLVTQPFYEHCDEMAWERAVWISEDCEEFGDQLVLVQYPNETPSWLRRTSTKGRMGVRQTQPTNEIETMAA